MLTCLLHSKYVRLSQLWRSSQLLLLYGYRSALEMPYVESICVAKRRNWIKIRLLHLSKIMFFVKHVNKNDPNFKAIQHAQMVLDIQDLIIVVTLILTFCALKEWGQTHETAGVCTCVYVRGLLKGSKINCATLLVLVTAVWSGLHPSVNDWHTMWLIWHQ